MVSLGHCNDDAVRNPRQVSSLAGEKVVDLAIGKQNCLALTDDGEFPFQSRWRHDVIASFCDVTGSVYTWGRSEQQQQTVTDQTSAAKNGPTRVTELKEKPVVGVACGPTQVPCT